jgi:hypothetical protein
MAEAIDAAGNAFGRLEAMAGAYLGFALANPHRCRLMFGPGVKGSPYLVVHGRFVGVALECREAGQLPEEDPMKLAALMYATAHGAVGPALSGHTQEAEGLGEPLAPARLPLAGLRISCTGLRSAAMRAGPTVARGRFRGGAWLTKFRGTFNREFASL